MQTNTHTPRLDFDSLAPRFASAMNKLDGAAASTATAAGLEPALCELVKIHVAQLNGCAYCIDMHTKDARAAGETEQRIYALPAWRETPYFSERERAALALTEAVTVITGRQVPDEVFDLAGKYFTEAELAALLSVLVTINAWTRIGVAAHPWAPGSYRP